MSKTCVSCIYLDHTTESPFCRRYPPQLVVVAEIILPDNGVRRFFPVVNPTLDWCGEFTSAPKKRSKKIEA